MIDIFVKLTIHGRCSSARKWSNPIQNADLDLDQQHLGEANWGQT
jgi:hypothetical protein